nr:integrase, catalytic region, zinc finger, CCHC-type, peptidase aspartic, catalytic [Tanacetum cinerariifolium]
MVNLSPVGSLNDDMVEPRYDSDTLSVVPHYDTYHDSDVLNSNIQELGYIENTVSTNESYDELKAIMGYGDLKMDNILISRVYYIEGLGHNLFPVGQFCDSDLEVAFRKHTCFVRNLEGVDLLSGSCGSNLYTILMADMMNSFPIFLLFKALKIKS